MTHVARFAAVALATLALGTPAQAGVRPISGSAPIDLRGFLLRADEPKQPLHEFHRTPAFGWSPVRGAIRYEFQLSTSNLFRENSIVYADANVRTPAVSLTLSLPWISGKPYALYARVRAVLPNRITPWSALYGFNMAPPQPPQPMSTYPGLLRWSPVDGATAYDVWLLDPEPDKVFTVNTNVADQREFFTLRSWTSSVSWRVRAVRTLYGARKNGLPAVSYGRWSRTYTAVNPPPSFGAERLVDKQDSWATVSDTITDSETSPAHGLMPAFVWKGNASLSGSAAQLFRVYVFTDKNCLNVVYRGAIVGGQAYAPRPLGPLALSDPTLRDRAGFLSHGDEGTSFTADGILVSTTESDPPGPNAEFGLDTDRSGGSSNGSASGGSSGAPGNEEGGANTGPSQGSSATGGQAGAGTSLPAAQTARKAPVDLWDTDRWPHGGYWWTVVPVKAVPTELVETTLAETAQEGATTIRLVSAAGLKAANTITIGGGRTEESATIVSISGLTVTLKAPLLSTHTRGDPVQRPQGQLEYRDLDLAQDACDPDEGQNPGGVRRFGKKSEPTLLAAGTPFVSGLSPRGRLIAASGSAAVFYGPPLVAWKPAYGAGAYEVQWSKSANPFRAEARSKTGNAGLTTYATSATLPLGPGTWYYRVRGLNFGVPGGASQMSWSNPVKLVVTRPRFVVVP